MGSAADALKKMAGGMPGKKKSKPKTEAKKSNGQSGAAKPAKAAAKKAPKKSPKKAPAKAAPKKSPKSAKASKSSKTKAPKKSSAKTRADLPEVTKATERVYQRDKNGDGLTPIERKIMTIIEKNGGEMSIANIAAKLFSKKVDDIPREGVESFRTVRNGIRKPLEYGLLLRSKTERAVVKLSAAYKKSGLKAAERYMDRIRKESGKAPAKPTKGAKKAATKKEATKKAPSKGKKSAKGKKSPKRSPKK